MLAVYLCQRLGTFVILKSFSGQKKNYVRHSISHFNSNTFYKAYLHICLHVHFSNEDDGYDLSIYDLSITNVRLGRMGGAACMGAGRRLVCEGRAGWRHP